MPTAIDDARAWLRGEIDRDPRELVRRLISAHPAPAATGEGVEAACDGALHPALAPHHKEWYRLCERRFTVERMSISGALAEAIVEAIACGCCTKSPTPAQQGGAVTEAIYEAAYRCLVAGVERALDEIEDDGPKALKYAAQELRSGLQSADAALNPGSATTKDTPND